MDTPPGRRTISDRGIRQDPWRMNAEREITSTDAGSHGRLEPGGIANPQTTQRRRPLPDLVGFGSFRNALHYYCSKEEDGVK
jgi:hypothetical protein